MIPTKEQDKYKYLHIDAEQAISMFKEGSPLIIVDDEDRENEGDVAIPAQFCTASMVNFMAKEARGLICTPLDASIANKLNLSLMTGSEGDTVESTAFTVTVEAAVGITTGISAQDRATTISVLANKDSIASDLVKPGHVFPLKAREGGTLVRAGQTEASVDLCKMAGIYPVAVICEIMKDDGEMARMNDLEKFAEKHKLKIVTVEELISYRMSQERLIKRVTETVLPTKYGEFKVIAYHTTIDSKEHIALVMGDVANEESCLVRVHDQCVTGDVFGSQRCDCGEQLDAAMDIVSKNGTGIIVYMDQEGRGIGLHNKLKAYSLQDQGLDTVEANEALGFAADKRDYGVGCQILVDLGIQKMRLITNNPKKRSGLEGFGLRVVERVPIEINPNEHNLKYLKTKRDKMGHLLNLDDQR
ncbi:MAG: bifunctional 3,4-dihydroxy-2-butanone-4-phosphate synthase/GTP cyclohydrolase II [Dehalococcoidia bacterium]|jgi:3,4-dihydroxy 2-butanone 4-phosphate synthase/GTP cyclohydrolase II|nr:MAG: 3,4-dihydroxy 2-butanone 4-phosphate synthase / GTP cyclohydrolase II [Chloroflexota bacterium]